MRRAVILEFMGMAGEPMLCLYVSRQGMAAMVAHRQDHSILVVAGHSRR